MNANEEIIKFPRVLTAVSRDSKIILRRSGTRLESGKRITFYPNIAKNRPI